MTQICSPDSNTIARFAVFGAVFFAGFALWAMGAVQRSPWTSLRGHRDPQNPCSGAGFNFASGWRTVRQP